jgi:SAM-dependent methyltransferase
MSVGSALRNVLGPATDPVARLYRRWYIDLDDFGRTIGRLGPVGRAVEVGCGDGHLTERLAAELPTAEILGIDVADQPGRLYHGDTTKVRFEQITAQDLASREPASFDLVVLSDVLHHVDVEHRRPLLAAVCSLVAPGGHFVCKDWIRGRNPASVASWLSDRYITGDRIVLFRDREEFVEAISTACNGRPIVAEGRVPPRWNNLYLVVAFA